VNAFETAGRRLGAARRRWAGLDHLCRTIERYDEVLGGRLAAAIAYYGFFAVFALALIGYAVFGVLLQDNAELADLVRQFLRSNLPFLDVRAIQDSGRTIGIVGIVGLGFTGIGWVESIRSSQRAIWGLDQQPGNLVIRRLVDLAVLAGVLLLVAAAAAAVYAFEAVLDWATGGFVLDVVSWVLAVAVNMLLAAALLVAVPRLRMTARRLRSAVLLVGIGITLLNTVGRSFVSFVQQNPAYALVGSAVGLLVYLYVFNQMLLFGAAWAATSRHGEVIDYSVRRPAPRAASPESYVSGESEVDLPSGTP
jgi:membrane protein